MHNKSIPPPGVPILKILLPVDGSGSSIRTAEFVASLAAKSSSLTAHLVDIQPLGDDWMTRRLLKADELVELE